MIICSISTIPNRTNSLIRVLNELLLSSLLPDLVLITISEYYPRVEKKYPKQDLIYLENFLKSYPLKSEIIKKDIDVGPVVKLLTPLEWIEKNSKKENCFILTIDDDSPLYNRALESMTNSYYKNNNSVYSIMGCNPGEFIHAEDMTEEKEVQGIGGYRGVLYPYHLIKEIKSWIEFFLEQHKKENIFPMHDDHIFSYYMRNKNIKMNVVPIPDKNYINYKPIPNNDGIMSDSFCGISLEKTNTIYKKTLEME
jgi:hypothetical protein